MKKVVMARLMSVFVPAMRTDLVSADMVREREVSVEDGKVIVPVNIPAGFSGDGLPLGLQVIGRAFDEETMFRVSGVVEDAAAFDTRPHLLRLLPEGAEGADAHP